MSRSTAILGVIGLTVWLAACGDDPVNPGTTTTTSTTTAPATTTTTTSTAAPSTTSTSTTTTSTTKPPTTTTSTTTSTTTTSTTTTSTTTTTTTAPAPSFAATVRPQMATCDGCHLSASPVIYYQYTSGGAYAWAVARSASSNLNSLFYRKPTGRCTVASSCASATPASTNNPTGHSGLTPWPDFSAGEIAARNWINGGRAP